MSFDDGPKSAERNCSTNLPEFADPTDLLESIEQLSNASVEDKLHFGPKMLDKVIVKMRQVELFLTSDDIKNGTNITYSQLVTEFNQLSGMLTKLQQEERVLHQNRILKKFKRELRNGLNIDELVEQLQFSFDNYLNYSFDLTSMKDSDLYSSNAQSDVTIPLFVGTYQKYVINILPFDESKTVGLRCSQCDSDDNEIIVALRIRHFYARKFSLCEKCVFHHILVTQGKSCGYVEQFKNPRDRCDRLSDNFFFMEKSKNAQTTFKYDREKCDGCGQFSDCVSFYQTVNEDCGCCGQTFKMSFCQQCLISFWKNSQVFSKIKYWQDTYQMISVNFQTESGIVKKFLKIPITPWTPKMHYAFPPFIKQNIITFLLCVRRRREQNAIWFMPKVICFKIFGHI